MQKISASSAFFEPSMKGKLFFLFQNFYQHRFILVSLLIFEIIFSLLNAVLPYFTKLQVDQLQQQQSLFFSNTFTPQAWFTLLLIVPAGIEFVRLHFFEEFSIHLSRRFRTHLSQYAEKLVWKKLETFDIGFFQNTRNQRLLDATIGSTRVADDFFQFVRSRLNSLVRILAIIPLFGLISWQLLILVALATALQALINIRREARVKQLDILDQNRSDKLWRVEGALRRYFSALNLFGATQKLLTHYYELLSQRDIWERERSRSLRTYETAHWVVSRFMEVSANVFVGYQVLQGNLSLGTFTLVLSYTLQLSGIFSELFRSLEDWQKIDLQFDRLHFFLHLRPRIVVAPHPVSVQSEPQEITFQNVHFQYPDFSQEERAYIQMMLEKGKVLHKKWRWNVSENELKEFEELLKVQDKREEVLKGIDLNITRGKVVALLGRNGAGKTTTTQLLLHQYEPTAGTIKLDEVIINQFSHQEFVSQFGVIQQDPVVLAGFTIRENALLGVDRVVTDAELWEIFQELLIDDVLRSLPNQLDTIVGEQTNFSGGQEQLIAVSRVFLQQRNFMIFDEGMSQMDIEKETRVVNLFKKEAKRAGVLFITHRITTARKADLIYFLDNGKVVEKGTHQELLEKKGLYAHFWNMQVVE